jgi:hypothetical protein
LGKKAGRSEFDNKRMEVVMAYLDKVAGAVSLALGILALAAVVSTDAYSYGARTDASSYKVLTRMIGNGSSTLCLNDHDSATRQDNGAVAE